MKFVDEANIRVVAGKGGAGSASFRREKYVEKGGPDGGDGGSGGSVYLVGHSSINTLSEFRVAKRFRAQDGGPGARRQMTGASGEDLRIDIPVGTIISDVTTGEIIGDMAEHGQEILVAAGGGAGLGNVRFKSSVNRAPRKTTPGKPGESRQLHLELKLLADVGLLGLPNAGKSTLIRALSGARPKVASYPFTTLHPSLGVVNVDAEREFVMADIPGLIEGAAEGAGLGIRFLKHLQRTRILLHLVDLWPLDEAEEPVEQIQAIVRELERFSPELAERPRWLVFNKCDLNTQEESDRRGEEIVNAIGFEGPVFHICALSGQGTKALATSVMNGLEALQTQEEAAREEQDDYDPLNAILD